MSSIQEISLKLNEVWMAASIRWKGEAAEKFYQNYVMKMMEEVAKFEVSCANLNECASELIRELENIEQNIE